MTYLRNRLAGRGRGLNNNAEDKPTNSSNGNDNRRPDKAVLIHPGSVEEAVHRINHQGGINLSELRFVGGEWSTRGIDSVVDIAIFQVPEHCNSHTCNLSEYGVGTMERYNGVEYLRLCNSDGRLQIQKDRFRGHHFETSVPWKGEMPQDRILDGAEIIVSEKDRTYEVMLANCNMRGRDISVMGQVVFESFRKSSALHAQDDVSGLHLLMTGVAVFLLFTVCSFRIHMGTRADYSYSRLLPIFHVPEGNAVVDYTVAR
jgi:hypothetical protein